MRQGLVFLRSRIRNMLPLCNGLFTLSDADSDSDSKPDGYIVLYRNCSHCTDSESDSDPDPDP